jgi:hypothetical protein
MSRFVGKGKDPIFGTEVFIAYGWDQVPGFSPGYFFQAWDEDSEGNESFKVNEGMLNGISEDDLKSWKKMFSVSEVKEIAS